MKISNRGRYHKSGFTLVELLVVIAIIGVLVALLLPAIQAAREASRRSTCQNHLKQLALGCLNHESNLGHYPTGGWGVHWVGDADRGFGADQPGGWIYNLLPFIEQQALHDLSRDGDPDTTTQVQLDGTLEMLQNPINIINCPSRRAGVFPADSDGKQGNTPAMAGFLVGRSDYAANVGDGSVGLLYDSDGPPSYTAASSPYFRKWITQGNLGQVNEFSGDPAKRFNGVVCERSLISSRHVTDGTSSTYLCGEKYLNPANYNGDLPLSKSDNETWCTGMNNDNYRNGADPPRHDGTGVNPNANILVDGEGIYGSAHSAAFHMAFCDGHVESLSYDIDLPVHQYNSSRDDGNVTN